MRAQVENDRTTVALLAHGMLTSLSVVRASLWLAASSEDGQVREEVMRHGMEQITLINDTLVDLVHGLSPEALEMLREARRADPNIDSPSSEGLASADPAVAGVAASEGLRVPLHAFTSPARTCR